MHLAGCLLLLIPLATPQIPLGTPQSPQTVAVTEIRGLTYPAQFLGWSDSEVELQVGGRLKRLATQNIRELEFENSPIRDSTGPVYRVQLVDGTELNATSIACDGTELRIRVPQKELEFPATLATTVLLRELDDTQLSSWAAITGSSIASDVLVLQQGDSENLTSIEGIIKSIADQAVAFEFSGQEIQVPFARLTGFRLASNRAPIRSALKAVVFDVHGNEWIVSKLLNSGKQEIQMQLQCGITAELALNRVQRIDFSVGSMRYLADMEPLQRESTPVFKFPLQSETDPLFAARRIAAKNRPGRAQGPILQFLGSGQATYRIPDTFSKLQGSVELRPTGEYFTPCFVRILVEGKIKFEQQLSLAKQRFEFEIDVVADDRVQLLVQSSSKQPTGELVLWSELRLLK